MARVAWSSRKPLTVPTWWGASRSSKLRSLGLERYEPAFRDIEQLAIRWLEPSGMQQFSLRRVRHRTNLCYSRSMNASAGFGALRFWRYLNLETYRKNGKPVRTPVWFALARGGRTGETIYVYTTADSGKVKRIRNNPAARIAPCDPFGWFNGRWIEVRVEIVTGEAARRGMRRIACKYIPWKQFLDVLSAFGQHERIVLAIRRV